MVHYIHLFGSIRQARAWCGVTGSDLDEGDTFAGVVGRVSCAACLDAMEQGPVVTMRYRSAAEAILAGAVMPGDWRDGTAA